MAQIQRLHDPEIENGNIINAPDLDDEFNQLVSESNSQDTRLTTVETANQTITGVKTFTDGIKTDTIDEVSSSVGVTVDSVLLKDGYIRLLPVAGFTPTLDGQIGYDDTSDTYDVHVNGTPREMVHSGNVGNFASGYPTWYSGTAHPVYLSASTFSVARIAERAVSDAANIQKNTSTMVDISTVGLNGVAQSANLTGTITVASGSATVTGTTTTFTTDFVPGDVITTAGGQTRVVSNVGSNTSLTVTSTFSSSEPGVTYKRGGEGINAWYWIYAITNTVTPGLILSTRNVAGGGTLVDLPSGYTESRQLKNAPTIRNNASANILPWYYADSLWLYDFLMGPATGTDATLPTGNIVDNGNDTTFTDKSLASFVPPTSRMAYLSLEAAFGGAGLMYVKAKGATNDGLRIATAAGATQIQLTAYIPTDANQLIQYKNSTASLDAHIDVMGYAQTEIP